MWKFMAKRLIPLMLAISLCVMLSVTAFAVQARYIYDINADNGLDITGSMAVMYSDMSGDSDITKVVITHTLQKKSGSSYSNVSGTSRSKTFYNESMVSFESVVSCTGSGTYRVKTVYSVTGPEGTESHTIYSNSVSC